MAIGVHIPPHPGRDFDDLEAGDKHVLERMKEVAKVYKKYETYFPDPREVMVVYARFDGETALPDKKDLIEKCIREMGLTFETEAYQVMRPGEPRVDHHGTAFVDGAGQPRPKIYLEDRQVGPGARQPPNIPFQVPAQSAASVAILPQNATSSFVPSGYTLLAANAFRIEKDDILVVHKGKWVKIPRSKWVSKKENETQFLVQDNLKVCIKVDSSVVAQLRA